MEVRARVAPEVNKYLLLKARSEGISKNKLIEDILNKYVLEVGQ